mmetsp:Transcript_14724/g.48042  ORF Transcript_14724/g.48042 Transcript_14724/m.48042 type:complete len:262 (+) Transcript_14724:175-960(+)
MPEEKVVDVFVFENNDQKDVVNGSPFCVKAALYLKAAEVPHDFPKPKAGDMGPTGKLPYAKFADGSVVPDSAIIIQKVQAMGYDLDGVLSDDQKVQSRLIVATLEERLYFGLLYLSWQHPKNWPLTKKAFFGNVPFGLRWLISRSAHKGIVSALHGQGTGRRPVDEIVAINNKVIDDLADLLGDKPNFFDTPKLTTADVVAYAMLDKALYPPLPFNPIGDHLKTKLNLLAFLDAITKAYFPSVYEARQSSSSSSSAPPKKK